MASSSILTTTKKALGIEEAYEAFDVDIIMHINSIFSILAQLGVGPAVGFRIEDKTTLWNAFTGDNDLLNMVETYMYLRVRMLFDKGTTSFAISADKEEYKEIEFRLSLYSPEPTYSSEGS